MKTKIWIFLVLLLSASCIFAAAPSNSFTIQNIRFVGLERITPGTALSYLPVKVGDTLTPTETKTVIRSLYQTGFFSDVELARQGNTLIITVEERPVIGSINITGNKSIPTKKLNPALDRIGLSVGQTFNSSMLEEVKSSLLQEYYARGNYSAQINATVVPQDRNRVDINIQIDEGVVAKIKQIQILGNHAFSQKKLLKQFSLKTPNLLSWITDSDLYSKEKLDADLEHLKTFYMNNGYIKFKVVSSQVSITPDKKSVYIVIKINEGPQYRFSGYELHGDLIVPRAQLEKQIKIVPGAVFSRQVVIDTEKVIAKQLGDVGYLFVMIRPTPIIDEEKKTVQMIYQVEPGPRVYVHQINLVGNTKTSDDVLRRALRQEEGALASITNIKESERQLRLLPYLKDISVKTVPTPGSTDQVDLSYSMKEQESAELSLSLGYSDNYGLLYGAGINESDFLGSGKAVGVNFSKDDYERNISLSYNNPYYTVDGIQRGFSVYSQKFEPGAVNLADYTTEQNGAQVNYSIPVSKNSNLNLGGGFQNVHVNAGENPSTQVLDYLSTNGDNFNQILINAGWSYNGYDQIIFPTQGFSQAITSTVSLPVTGDPLEYWEAGYQAHWYQPLVPSRDWIFSLRGAYDHGGSYGQTQGYPFFENYYAGGIGTVRGFEGNTLGPRDSNGEAIGGNTLLDGTAEIILPPWISENIRTSAFVDAGNVFDGGVQTNQIRYSAGLDLVWRVPMLGPMEFSVAYPLNKKPGDNTQIFNFQVGTTF